MQETPVQSLAWEDPLEEEMATTPVFLPGESCRQRKLVGSESMGSQRVGHNCVCVCTHREKTNRQRKSRRLNVY